MHKLNYKQIQKLQASATKKLLKYISKEIQDTSILEELDFFYPDFGQHKHRLVFNVWISIDFLGKDGNTFIEKFLNEKSTYLTEEERSILIERNLSNISLFEILESKGEYIQVLDLLENKKHRLWVPELAANISANDLILARIGNLLGHLTVLGDISYLPSTVKSMFLEDVFIDFNFLRKSNPSLVIKEYLKKHSLHLYKIYSNCIFEAMDMEESVTLVLYDELDEFESYLKLKSSNPIIKKHISNLIDFFESYLADEELTLYDMNQIDFNLFFKEAIEDNFIISQEDLNSYISTFKRYLGFLSNKSSDYKDSYNELLHISKTRFHIINKLKLNQSPFEIDREMSNSISGFLNDEALILLMDYDKFILYILDRPLDLTLKNKYIKRINLMEINDILDSHNNIDKKAPNQPDFPLINLFYHFSIDLGLVYIEDNSLKVTKKGSSFIRLPDEDKYTLLFQYIWGNKYISKFTTAKNKSTVDKFKKDLRKFLSSLDENINYEIATVLPTFSSEHSLFMEYYVFLQYLGIIRCKLYPNYEISIGYLTTIILDHLKLKDNTKQVSTVIELDQFKKSKLY